jgi:hypothetical protein
MNPHLPFLALLALVGTGCDAIWFELPGTDDAPDVPDTAAPDSDTAAPDTDTDPDTDSAADTDTSVPDTDTGPRDTAEDTDVRAPCAPAAWSWGVETTLDSAEASFVGASATAGSGVSLVAPGDMDGDGVGDLVLGALYEGGDNEGAVYFATGVTRTLDQPLDGLPYLLGEPAMSVADIDALGDVDGDGLADVGLAPGWGTAGYGWLVRGRTSGWPAAGTGTLDFYDLDNHGGLGDIDGDGLDDWLLTAWNDACVVSGAAAAGALDLPTDCLLWTHHTAVDGMDSVRIQTVGDFDGDGLGDLIGLDADWGTVYPLLAADVAPYGTDLRDVATARIAASAPGFNNLRTVDDLDGDGGQELALLVGGGGAVPSGAYLFLDTATWTGVLTPADAELVIGAGENMGSPTVVGDLNGDGFPDLGVSVTDRTGAMDVYLYFGRAVWPSALALADADVHITGDSASRGTLRLPDPTTLGDIDGDGLADLVLRIPYEDSGAPAGAWVSVYRGRATWPAELGAAEADITFVGNSASLVETLVVEDVDGDGCDDVVMGVNAVPAGETRGTTFVHFGQPAP